MPEFVLSNGNRVTIADRYENGNLVEVPEIHAAMIAEMEEHIRLIELQNRYRDQNSEIQEGALARREPPYQTFEEINAAKYIPWIRPKPGGIERLFWTLSGSIETSAGVFEDSADEAGNEKRVCVPYFDASNGTWHPVSKTPITEPRVSSMTVRVHEFEDWDGSWDCLHYEHYDDLVPSEEEIERIRTTGVSLIPSGGCHLAEWDLVKIHSESKFGRIPNKEDADPDAGYVQVIACCGVPRPIENKDKATVQVRPSNPDGPDGGYVTVHDYVTTVHPWLMGIKSDLLAALGIGDDDGDFQPLPDNTPLVCFGTMLGRAHIKKTVDLLHESGIPLETVAAFTAGQDVTYKTKPVRAQIHNDTLTPFVQELIRRGIFDKWPGPCAQNGQA